MDRYQKAEKPKPESPINENEIRITSQGAIRSYINYAIALLQIVDQENLEAVEEIKSPVAFRVAAWFGEVRLIDNM